MSGPPATGSRAPSWTTGPRPPPTSRTASASPRRPSAATSTRWSPTRSSAPREQRVYGARDPRPPGQGLRADRLRPGRLRPVLRQARRRRPALDRAVRRRRRGRRGGRRGVRPGPRSRPRPGRTADAIEAAAPEERTEALAKALSADGYAATARSAPHPQRGEQLCQHHCPVAHAAEQFPQLCEAETEVFSRLLGTHVQRLATIAHGDGVCTTFIPHGAPPQTTHQQASASTAGRNPA